MKINPLLIFNVLLYINFLHAFEPERLVPTEEEIQAFTEQPNVSTTQEPAQPPSALVQSLRQRSELEMNIHDWLYQRATELSTHYKANIVLRDAQLDPETGAIVAKGTFNGKPIKAIWLKGKLKSLQFLEQSLSTIKEEEEG